ncbi:hypothetical protein A2397_01905 [Candidatus Amesbacteria bacterium RIFOXYB1_FULL_44_23]|uniref:Uncharacterized protein n=1 Tax=Candidatus Amesbacteria bacterium RIFOXYB1_FULL_44_23 TaxID=1797263 RepID=A0A1F4ZSQ6_9BACT|nr:MAG: hypothetical protein A2397_01905 [Candidatus Amesbacteria bacterium RIFOXYB1_FULL_44_23]
MYEDFPQPKFYMRSSDWRLIHRASFSLAMVSLLALTIVISYTALTLNNRRQNLKVLGTTTTDSHSTTPKVDSK